MHSYFGQVGNQISASRATRESVPVTTPLGASYVEDFHPVHHRERKRQRRSSASSGSMVMVQREHVEGSPPPPPHEKPQKSKSDDTSERHDPKFPPTPVSSSSSMLQKEADALKDGKAETDTGGLTSITQALKDFVVSKSLSPGKDRRHTAAPISSVTANPVHAHISNPITSPSPPELSNPQNVSSDVTEKNVDSLLRRLTIDATDGSREKNTPPHTPRASNHDDSSQQETRPTPSEQNGQTVQEARGASPASDAEKPSSNRTSGVSVGAPKGKLTLKISEARGLRPSYDPYIVSTFEWSEFISQGRKPDTMDVDHEEKKSRKEQLSALPIRRTDSDVGKPMAIPMKSRQSSNNSQLDKTEAKNSTMVTDPQWDHEAVL